MVVDRNLLDDASVNSHYLCCQVGRKLTTFALQFYNRFSDISVVCASFNVGLTQSVRWV